MDFEIVKVKGYSCPNKHLLLINGEPVLFANGTIRLRIASAYVQGYETEESIGDKKILRVLNKYKEQWENIK
jgi:hypothetical protein